MIYSQNLSILTTTTELYDCFREGFGRNLSGPILWQEVHTNPQHPLYIAQPLERGSNNYYSIYKEVHSMNHKLWLYHIGPIQECDLALNEFTVLTGPQSSGKSTVAKAIYFFRTVKQDILNIVMQGGPQAVSDRNVASWRTVLTQRLKDKFLQLFGTSWIMPLDMEMKYTYKKNVSIRVSLTENYDEPLKNYIQIEFSSEVEDYLADLGQRNFSNISSGQRKHVEQQLSQWFNDPYETVFIPAGRNLITLLSAQLNYIFTSLEDSQLRNIDYITKRYTELILKLKPTFSNGMDGVIQEIKADPLRLKKYKEIQPVVDLLMNAAKQVLNGSYRYTENEERLYLADNTYVKINLASSGQQEVVWLFNLLFYYLVEQRKVFLIVEEPESHLYPSSQQTISYMLSLMLTSGNAGIVTTHSPYVLGTLNTLLLAGQVPTQYQEEVKLRLNERFWLDAKKSNAYYIHNGKLEPAVNEDDGLKLIKNELIDGASTEINALSDFLLGFLFSVGE